MRRSFLYRVLKPDGSDSAHTVKLTEPELGELKEVVEAHLDGGDMEHVTIVAPDGARADMFVDEMGIVKNLPRNEAATALYRAAWLNNHPDDDPEKLPFIAGVAVLFAEAVWFILPWALVLLFDDSHIYWYHSGAHCILGMACWA